jgi:hypothetical protein
MIPQDLEVINRAILSSIFCLGLVIGGVISMLVDSFFGRKK